MKRFPGMFTALLVGLLPFVASSIVYGAGFHDRFDAGRRYPIMITNVSHGQVISPLLVIVRKKAFRLFTPGEAAIPELAELAEDGKTDSLIGLLSTIPSVLPAGTLVSGQTQNRKGSCMSMREFTGSESCHR
jgi:hypothetical protein